MPVFPDSHETREITCATDAAEAITTPATGVNVSTEVRVVTMEVVIEPNAMRSLPYFTDDVPQVAAVASAFFPVSPAFWLCAISIQPYAGKNDRPAGRDAVLRGRHKRTDPPIAGRIEREDAPADIASRIQRSGDHDSDIRPSERRRGTAQIRRLESVGVRTLNDDIGRCRHLGRRTRLNGARQQPERSDEPRRTCRRGSRADCHLVERWKRHRVSFTTKGQGAWPRPRGLPVAALRLRYATDGTGGQAGHRAPRHIHQTQTARPEHEAQIAARNRRRQGSRRDRETVGLERELAARLHRQRDA